MLHSLLGCQECSSPSCTPGEHLVFFEGNSKLMPYMKLLLTTSLFASLSQSLFFPLYNSWTFFFLKHCSGTSLEVQGLRLCAPNVGGSGPGVWRLVGELRSCMPHGAAKQTNKQTIKNIASVMFYCICLLYMCGFFYFRFFWRQDCSLLLSISSVSNTVPEILYMSIKSWLNILFIILIWTEHLFNEHLLNTCYFLVLGMPSF